MPTGYTCILTDHPETTFARFAMRCARAFGVLIHMRDESLNAPVPEKIEPEPYYRESLDEAMAKARELETMTAEEAERRAELSYEYRVKSRADAEAKYAAEDATFKAMLAQVEAWEPPTKDHVEMKKFMRDQLEKSMHGPLTWAVEKLDGPAWLAQEKERAAENVRYYANQWKAAREGAERATAWLADLRRSLPISAAGDEK